MRLGDEKGGALVEFAIILPILLLLIGGITDFGILFYDKQVLTNACREGARAGIVYEVDPSGNKIIITQSDVQQIVQEYCGCTPSDCSKKKRRLITFVGSPIPPTVSAPGVDSLNYPADLTVTVNFTYTFLMSSLLNLFGGSFGPTLDISAETVMRME